MISSACLAWALLDPFCNSFSVLPSAGFPLAAAKTQAAALQIPRGPRPNGCPQKCHRASPTGKRDQWRDTPSWHIAPHSNQFEASSSSFCSFFRGKLRGSLPPLFPPPKVAADRRRRRRRRNTKERASEGASERASERARGLRARPCARHHRELLLLLRAVKADYAWVL